jgi:hypothetical protein
MRREEQVITGNPDRIGKEKREDRRSGRVRVRGKRGCCRLRNPAAHRQKKAADSKESRG